MVLLLLGLFLFILGFLIPLIAFLRLFGGLLSCRTKFFFVFGPLDIGLFHHNNRIPSFGIGLLSLVVMSLSSDGPFLGVYGTRMPLGRRCLRGVCSLKSLGDILVEVGVFQCDFL